MHGALPTPTRNDSPLSTIAAKLGDSDISNPQQTKPKRSTDGTLSDVRARSVTQRLDEKLGPDRSSKSLASAVPFEGAGKATDRCGTLRAVSQTFSAQKSTSKSKSQNPPPISPTRYRSVRSASLRHPEEAANTAPIRAELDARVRTAKALALGGRLGVASQPSAHHRTIMNRRGTSRSCVACSSRDLAARPWRATRPKPVRAPARSLQRNGLQATHAARRRFRSGGYISRPPKRRAAEEARGGSFPSVVSLPW